MSIQAVIDLILTKILGAGYDLIDVIVLLFVISMFVLMIKKRGRR